MIFILGFSFIVLPHLNINFASILSKNNDNIDLTTKALNFIHVQTDPTNDFYGNYFASGDIIEISENIAVAFHSAQTRQQMQESLNQAQLKPETTMSVWVLRCLSVYVLRGETNT